MSDRLKISVLRNQYEYFGGWNMWNESVKVDYRKESIKRL